METQIAAYLFIAICVILIVRSERPLFTLGATASLIIVTGVIGVATNLTSPYINLIIWRTTILSILEDLIRLSYLVWICKRIAPDKIGGVLWALAAYLSLSETVNSGLASALIGGYTLSSVSGRQPFNSTLAGVIFAGILFSRLFVQYGLNYALLLFRMRRPRKVALVSVFALHAAADVVLTFSSSATNQQVALVRFLVVSLVLALAVFALVYLSMAVDSPRQNSSGRRERE